MHGRARAAGARICRMRVSSISDEQASKFAEDEKHKPATSLNPTYLDFMFRLDPSSTAESPTSADASSAACPASALVAEEWEVVVWKDREAWDGQSFVCTR